MVRKQRAAAVSILIVFLTAAAGAFGGQVPVSGLVVDEQGRPVARAQVAMTWAFENGRLEPQQPLTTDAEGRFKGVLLPRGEGSIPLMVLDAGRERGVAAVFDLKQLESPVELKIASLPTVRGRIDASKLAPTPHDVRLDIFAPGNVRVIESTIRPGPFRMQLPAGRYSFWVISPGTSPLETPVTIEAGAKVVDLEPIVLEPTGAPGAGKPAPPLTVTEARGVPKDVKLSDYKGKWVILEFWGYWCGPCVGRALPNLMHFCDQHKDQSDRFVVLTFHHGKRVNTLEDVAPQLAHLEKTRWKRDFPFPIIVDSSGKTMRDWGVRALPTAMLIDPDGKVVAGGAGVNIESILLEKLAAEKKK